MALTASVRWCNDCESEHLGAPCGMTWLQRIRSQTVDTAWMPARTKKNYFDDESLSAMFGANGEERKEQLMEETDGVGAYTAEDRKKYPGVESFYTLGEDSDE